MKVILDEGLPRVAAYELRKRGVDAREQEALLVTLDSDFHTMLVHSGAILPSVARIRIKRLRWLELADIVELLLERFDDEIRSGAMITVDGPTSMRLRKLPIRRPAPKA